jgi:hypothetical protein
MRSTEKAKQPSPICDSLLLAVGGLADLVEDFLVWSAGMGVAMPDLPAVGAAPPKSGGGSMKPMTGCYRSLSRARFAAQNRRFTSLPRQAADLT